jgi:hypothetical protein
MSACEATECCDKIGISCGLCQVSEPKVERLIVQSTLFNEEWNTYRSFSRWDFLAETISLTIKGLTVAFAAHLCHCLCENNERRFPILEVW